MPLSDENDKNNILHPLFLITFFSFFLFFSYHPEEFFILFHFFPPPFLAFVRNFLKIFCQILLLFIPRTANYLNQDFEL